MNRKMFHTAVALLLCGLFSTASAQVYQWKDANGKTVYSDKPPAGKSVSIKQAPPSSDNIGELPSETKAGEPKGPKSLAERDLDFRKRQKENQEQAEKARNEQRQANQRSEYCDNNQRYLKTLESGERIATRDDKGERNYLDDAQREQEIAKTRQALSQCK